MYKELYTVGRWHVVAYALDNGAVKFVVKEITLRSSADVSCYGYDNPKWYQRSICSAVDKILTEAHKRYARDQEACKGLDLAEKYINTLAL